MKIYIGSDHAGYKLKEKLKTYLFGLGYEVVDQGNFEFQPTDDYPDFISLVAKMVASDKGSRGIILGASGQGEAMCANRVKGVRASVYYGGADDVIRYSRLDNDANVLSLGARFLSDDEAYQAVKLWLNTDFSNEERHKRRIEKIDNCEQAVNEF